MATVISGRRSRGTFGVAAAMLDGTLGRLANLKRRGVRGAWCVVAIGLAACAAPKGPSGDPEAEIGVMLRRSAADWNRGDLEGFMSDYAHDSLTSYLRRGHVQYGWQALHDHYQAD